MRLKPVIPEHVLTPLQLLWWRCWRNQQVELLPVQTHVCTHTCMHIHACTHTHALRAGFPRLVILSPGAPAPAPPPAPRCHSSHPRPLHHTTPSRWSSRCFRNGQFSAVYNKFSWCKMKPNKKKSILRVSWLETDTIGAEAVPWPMGGQRRDLKEKDAFTWALSHFLCAVLTLVSHRHCWDLCFLFH